MKRSKFSEAQIAFVLKQADDGTSVGEVAARPGSAKQRTTTGDHHLVPDFAQGMTDQLLVLERTIHFGSIEHRDTKLDSTCDEPHGIDAVHAGSVARAQVHTPEAKRGY